MKHIVRLLLLVAVAAVIAALVWFAVSHLPPQLFSQVVGQGRRVRSYRRRQLEPQLTASISFPGELLIVGAIAFAGRRILKLRL